MTLPSCSLLFAHGSALEIE
ncbi:hypothetical protein Zm00014a_015138 [Zea mays]|uniref:Uncharacterized protein n=2 Tax=Zea mays TaxID=4577 RepID=A0A3L6G0I4_MAIZE|nr:hypothetical protein Zm00014a_015139 [Zea mays]PWZ40618.1 hypothetical protein Zm00014a_015138 [Zea mays]